VKGHGPVGQTGEALHGGQDAVGEGVGDGEQRQQVNVPPRPKRLRPLLRRRRAAVVQRVRLLSAFCRVARLLSRCVFRRLRPPPHQSLEAQSRDAQHDAQEPEEVLRRKVLLQILRPHRAVHRRALQLADALPQRHDAREQGAEALPDEERTDVLGGVAEHEGQEGDVGGAADRRQHEGEEQEEQRPLASGDRDGVRPEDGEESGRHDGQRLDAVDDEAFVQAPRSAVVRDGHRYRTDVPERDQHREIGRQVPS